MNEWMKNEWMNEWMNECMDEWRMNEEWMNEWMNECMDDCKSANAFNDLMNKNITLLVVELNNGVSFLCIKHPTLYLARAATSPTLKVHLKRILVEWRDVVYLDWRGHRESLYRDHAATTRLAAQRPAHIIVVWNRTNSTFFFVKRKSKTVKSKVRLYYTAL